MSAPEKAILTELRGVIPMGMSVLLYVDGGDCIEVEEEQTELDFADFTLGRHQLR